MIIKNMTRALLVSSAAALAACSSPSVVQQRDGSQVMTPDAPKYNNDTGFYEYEKDGKKVQVNRDDVKTIEEVK